MEQMFNDLSITDLVNALSIANKANDDDALFGVSYENDGGSAPHKIRGDRKKYAFDPMFIAQMRNELNGRITQMQKKWKAINKKK